MIIIPRHSESPDRVPGIWIAVGTVLAACVAIALRALLAYDFIRLLFSLAG